MSLDDGLAPVPPDGLRPAQIGVVMLGRVIIGDIGATAVDLAIRGLVDVQEAERDGSAWLVTPLKTATLAQRSEILLGYERTMLQKLSACCTAGAITAANPLTPRMLEDTRREIIRDAVHRGWLRHLRHDQRTAVGDKLTQQIRSFRRRLRQHATDNGPDAVSGPLLPYALHFGMLGGSDLPLARFAHDWVSALSTLPGWHQPKPENPDPLKFPVPLDNDSRAYQRGYMYPPSP